MTPLVAPTVDALTSIFALESIKGFGPQKFRELWHANRTAAEVIDDPTLLPIAGKRGEDFRSALAGLRQTGLTEYRARAQKQLERAAAERAHVLVHGDGFYPHNLWASNNPVPVLYVRGDLDILRMKKAVACVGSRGIAGRYQSLQSDFARYAAQDGWVVVSGFAMGADTVAHEAARAANGATICVMPSGLDRPFPPENKMLWQEFKDYPGALVLSEFPFGTAAASLTLRKRNKTIVGLALGVLVGQSSYKGGAMNAYRFGKEQKKPVASFEPDGTDSTSGNQLIVHDDAGTEFPGKPDKTRWATWLHGLSSSI